VTDGNWSDYVADAGTDVPSVDATADAMGDAASGVQTGTEAIDTAALSDDAAGAVADATYDAGQAASWAQWSQGDLETAASWDTTAAGYVESAQEWLAYGNTDGYEHDMAAAQTASGIADGYVGQASTDLGIGAGYMDNSVASGDTAVANVAAYDPGTATAYDAGVSTSYDGGATAAPAEAAPVDTSSAEA
jgi:hypothetical protein